MATDQVAAEPIGQAQGWLQVHGPLAGRLGRQGGARQGLAADIGPEPLGDQGGHRQAHPINTDTVAQGQVGRIEAGAGGDPHLHPPRR